MAIELEFEGSGFRIPALSAALCACKALSIAELLGSQINLVECHGTGTALGDPIETGALKVGHSVSFCKRILSKGAGNLNEGSFNPTPITFVIWWPLCVNPNTGNSGPIWTKSYVLHE